MKIYIAVILLLLLPAVSATVLYRGSLYSQSSFNMSGYAVTVAGINPVVSYDNVTNNYETTYGSVVFQSSMDDVIVVKNGSCSSTSRYSYCYVSSSFDFNNALTYKGGGALQPMIGVELDSLSVQQSDISVTRSSNIADYCGDKITIPISINNTGSTSTTFTYTEKLPPNTAIIDTIGGNVNSNIITFTDIIGPGASRDYTYSVYDTDCISKNWDGYYTYTTSNGTVSGSLANLTLTMLNSYNTTSSLSASASNDPTNIIRYEWNISNLNPTTLTLDISIDPGNLNVLSSNMIRVNNIYVLNSDAILPNSSTSEYMTFNAKGYGVYNIETNYSIRIPGWSKSYSSDLPVSYVEPKVSAEVYVQNSTRVLIYIQNYDVSNTYNIYGIFKGLGDESLYYNNLTSNARVLLLNKTFAIPNGTTLVFDGVYRDQYGAEKKLYISLNSSQALSTPPVNILSNTSNTSAAIVPVKHSNTTTINNTTNSVSNNSSGIPQTDNNGTDFITSMLESIGKLLQSLFG